MICCVNLRERKTFFTLFELSKTLSLTEAARRFFVLRIEEIMELQELATIRHVD